MFHKKRNNPLLFSCSKDHKRICLHNADQADSGGYIWNQNHFLPVFLVFLRASPTNPCPLVNQASAHSPHHIGCAQKITLEICVLHNMLDWREENGSHGNHGTRCKSRILMQEQAHAIIWHFQSCGAGHRVCCTTLLHQWCVALKLCCTNVLQ